MNVASNYSGSTGLPIETNNYYGNLFVSDGTDPIYVMPYSVFWEQGQGLCAWNTDSTKYVFGSYTTESTPGPHYYYSPVGNCPVGFSSAEMSSSQTVTATNIDHQSVHVTFSPGSGSGSMMIPLVQGNALLTSVYTDLTPEIFSGGAFTSFAPVTFKAGAGAAAGMSKYRITINNGDTWLVYLHSSNGGSTTMNQSSNALYTGPAGFSGVIQMAKLPLSYTSSDEEVYDSAAGTYATQNVISGTASGTTASYTFDFGPTSIAGNPLLSFLFPHQVASVTSGTSTTLELWSNTKGLMQAYLGNTLTFTESDLPTDIQFLPWSPLGNLQNYSASALQAIAAAANTEAAEVMSEQTDLNSMYYSGKALAKFAQICLTLNDVLEANSSSCVQELEQNIALFITNRNIYPLVYDTVWKGAISSCGDSGCDFGNAWYNDHHFHYGYFVYTAAVIAHIDSSWLTTGNKAWINTLIRDFANPSTSDTAFPQFRMFDWYAGHSWAHGITTAQDGKDEESSSEDYNAIYGMKLWGQVIGDASMEARGNLMLAVMRRSMGSYMLMSSDNTIEPAAFVPQYAAGITFMNKVDHTTYFGQNEEYIEGIHMLPLTPISAYIRTPTFVAEEWSAVIEPILSGVDSGWLGILMANLAISNSTAAYDFFSSPSFSSNYLDGGASLTWYLTYAAGLGGAGDFQLAVTAASGTVQTSAATATPTSKLVSGTAINVASASTSDTVSSSLSFFSTGSSLPAANLASTSLTISTYTSSNAISDSTESSAVPSTDDTSSRYATASSAISTSSGATISRSTYTTSVLSSDITSPSAETTSTTTAASATQSTTSLTSNTIAMSSSTPSSISFILAADNGFTIACPSGSLVVSTDSDMITLYANGTLDCGGQRAFADLQIQASGTLYDIDLMSGPKSSSVISEFNLDGTTLLLFVEALTLTKRQALDTSSQQLQFVYGTDNIIHAVPVGQNSTLTPLQLSAQMQTSISTTSVSSTTVSAAKSSDTNAIQISTTVTTATASDTNASQTSSTDTTASSSETEASQSSTQSQDSISVTTTTSTTVLQTMTSSVTIHMPPSSTTASVGPDGLAVGAQQIGDSVDNVTTSSVITTVIGSASSSTVTYTTTINGQATVLTKVIPITTVEITSTYTTTLCGQCTSTAVQSGSDVDAASSPDTGAAVVTTLTTKKSSPTSNVTAAIGSETDNEISAAAAAAAISPGETSAASTTIVSVAIVSTSGPSATMPIVSSSSGAALPSYTSSSTRVMASISSIMGLLVMLLSI